MDKDHVPGCKKCYYDKWCGLRVFWHITRDTSRRCYVSTTYIIQAEPLPEAIRQSHCIKGIHITNGTVNDELKRGQYVDDTTVFLGNSEYIKPCLDIISEYEKVSGAKLNINKTKCSVLRPQNVGRCEGIELALGPEVALGVPVGKDCQNQGMWEKFIVKVKAKLKMWEPRDLSYEGKNNIVKFIGLSSVQHAMQLQTVDFKHLKELDKLLTQVSQ